MNKYTQLKNKLQQNAGSDSIHKIPSIELYQFEIGGYTHTGTHTFDKFTNNINKFCGLIKTKSNHPSHKFNTASISSCDLLSSELDDKDKTQTQSGGFFNIRDYYTMYLEYEARSNTINNKFFTPAVSTEFLSMIESATKKSMGWVNKQKGSQFIRWDNISEFHTGALIYRITVPDTSRIVIFGDIHGSYHTFFRNMARLGRLGIINFINWKINPDYRIVFIGDVLDRGYYTVEILSFICKLIIANNTESELKIIYNRGNHETSAMYWTEGTGREFVEKIDPEKKLDVLKYLFNFVSALPSGLIIAENKTKTKLWVSHGGFPYSHTNSSPVAFPDEPVLFFPENSSSINTLDIYSIGNQVRWNDFNYLPSDTDEFDPVLSVRGLGFVLSQRKLYKFLKLNSINFVIRGHQDFYANSYLLTNKKDSRNNYMYKLDDASNPRDLMLGPIKFNQNIKKELAPRQVVNGPIARIRLRMKRSGEPLGTEPETIVYPMLTLSTNTDRNRPLVHDSFGVIRFDLSAGSMGEFDEMTDLVDLDWVKD